MGVSIHSLYCVVISFIDIVNLYQTFTFSPYMNKYYITQAIEHGQWTVTNQSILWRKISSFLY